MRLNWFSPLPPQRSDIAHYTARLAPALMRHFEVAFWTTEIDAHSIPHDAKIVTYSPGRLGEHEFYCELHEGLNIYNFGNDSRIHEKIYHIAQRVPGIAILHDTRLHHFIFERDRPSWSKYVELATELYGKKGAIAAREIVASNGALIDAHVEEMPFIEPFLAHAIGAICHSKSACSEARRRSSVPTLELPLPFASLAQTPRVKRLWSPPFRLIMFGYFGSNRRVEEIISALKEVRAEIDFRLDLFGILPNKAEVENLIGALGLRNRVALHGFVSEQALDDAIASAHLAFNLRHPTMGEASGGILRSWTHATPTLVTNAGWYADLPDQIVRKISIENERADLIQAVKELASDPQTYQALGKEAKEFVEAQHHPTGYVERLAHALVEVPELLTRFGARQVMNSVARHARSAQERTTFLERATPQIASLFGRGLTQGCK